MMRRFFYGLCIVVFILAVSQMVLKQASAKSVPETQAQIQLSFAPLVKKVKPAVVNIYTKRVVRRRVSPFMGDPFFEQFFGGGFGFQGMERERLERSLGSGVIVDEKGLLLTNAHVVQDAEEITAVLPDGREYEAEKVLIDKPSDLALLRIKDAEEALPYVELRPSETLEVGDLVIAIGNPFGVGQTVTSGIVSARGSSSVHINDFNFFIQTDAAINPGNSGGPLVAMDGRVVGINTAIFSKSGGSLGIGFAVPSEMVASLIAAAESGQAGEGGVKRPWLGFSSQKMTADIADSLGLKYPRGVLVSDMHSASPAKAAGLETGDVVVALNGRDVVGPEELKFRMAMVPLGETAVFEVLRKGKTRTVKIKASVAPEDPPRNETLIEESGLFAGLTVANINPAMALEYRLDAEKGVVIVKMSRRSAAARFMRPGDVIVAVNGQEIHKVSDLQGAVKNTRAQRGWDLVLERGGNRQQISIR